MSILLSTSSTKQLFRISTSSDRYSTLVVSYRFIYHIHYDFFTLTVTGVGDPHVNTIDNGLYTCHIQGLYVFAQTTADAETTAQNNLNSNLVDSNLIYPNDLFQIYVRSVAVTPALSYIQRTQGYGSIFSNYTITSATLTFVISNNNGNFGKYISD